jgi:HK97 family phage major capsid protein/HK97 family phage prohead protease
MEIKKKQLKRFFQTGKIDKESRTVELSFSSVLAVDRGGYKEVLEHTATSLNLNRLNNSAPLLFNHNSDDIVGVVESANLSDSKGIATVRFSNSKRGKEVFADVRDGILKNVSVGYEIDEYEIDGDTVRATKWTPFEISIVTIPADNTVGVGRKKEEKKLKMNKENDIKLERERIQEITAIARKHKLESLSDKAIADGVSVADFRTIVLDRLEEPKPIDAKANLEIGLNDKEVRQYSLSKVLRALANPQDARAQKEAGYEFEVSQEAVRQSGITPQGVLVPFDIFKRDLTTTTAQSTIATNTGSLIDILRNKSAVLPLAQVLSGLNGNVSFPKQTQSMSASKLAEGDATVDSDIGFGELTMSPSRFGGSGNYSKQLLHQSSVAIESLIRNDLMTQISLKIDAEAIAKILNEAGVGLVSLGDNGGQITNGSIVDLETEVAIDNADIGSLAYVMNARTKGWLKKTPITNGNPKMILENNELNGYMTHVSNQLPADLTKGSGTDLSAMIFGNFSDLLVGFWGGIDLIVDPYTLSKQGKISIVADQFADIGIRRAESFAVIKDAIVQ